MTSTVALQLLVTRLVALTALLATAWLWRDMRQRSRPVWLRLVVIVTGFVTGIGVVVWMVDLRRHPHETSLTARDVLLRRYQPS